VSTAASSGDLFFNSLIQGYVEKNTRFVRRDWLAKQLDQKLAEPGKHFVLLTAAPGAGKSTFMAQLAHDHPDWLRYFIRRDQREVLADVSDKSVLLRIAYQLAARHPELFSQEQLRVSVTQRIGQVAERGEAVGAEVKRLTALPFYQKILEIEQHVRADQGKVVGLRVEELVVEPRLLPAEDLLHLALVDPACALARIDPEKQLVILIDALDEIGYHQTAENILTWLTNCPDLPENIRLVLTSRPPDEALKLFCEKQASHLSQLTIAEDDPSVQADTQHFVKQWVEEPKVSQAITEVEGNTEAFAKKATDRARCNLGYLDALARGVDRAIAALGGGDVGMRQHGRRTLDALLSLKELPDDQGGLYAFFLNQIKTLVARERVELQDSETGETYDKAVWPAIYAPMLGVLAVAMEPVDLDLLIRLAGIRAEREWVSGVLDSLRQFLDNIDGRYRFYHATVAEFLTAATTRANPHTTALYQDPVYWNGRIAALFNSWFANRPEMLDNYAIKYRICHQIAGHGPERAHAAMTSEWMLFKRKHTGDDRSFHEDLMRVVHSLREETPPNIVALVRCSIIDAVLVARSAVLPPTVASIWAICGQRVHAESLISLISNPGKRTEALFHLAHGLEVTGAVESARDALRSAVAAAKTNPHYGDRLIALRNVLAAKCINADVASFVLEVAATTEAMPFNDSGAELSWQHQSLGAIYEAAAPLVPRTTLAELRVRLQQFLLKPGEAEVRASILLSAARISDLLGNASDVASFVERAFSETDRLPGIYGIRTLCSFTYRLKQLADRKWTATALGLAVSRLQEGLDAVAEAYAIPLIGKAALDAVPGFDLSQVDIERALELARSTQDPGVFRLLSDLFSAQGEDKRATDAADLCYQTVLTLHGRSQNRFTSMVSEAVIYAFRSSRHHSGLLELMDIAAGFRSPGSEWERDHLVDIVSTAAVHLQFNDVLERAFIVARDTRNIWERASALSRVGYAYAMAGDKTRALSIAQGVEDTVAEGLRNQFPRKEVQGALLLTAVASNSVHPVDISLTEESLDPRYLDVTRALTYEVASVVPERDKSLKSIVENLLKWKVAVFPLYMLLKKAVSEGDTDTLATVDRWEQETWDTSKRETVQGLRILAMKKDLQELGETARSIVDSFYRLDVIPEAALAVVDALVTAGMSHEASLIVDRLKNSARQPRADANQQVAWETAAFLVSQRLNGGTGLQEPLIALLDHARDVGMLTTARTIADTAPAIAALFGPQSVLDMLGVIDEAATLK